MVLLYIDSQCKGADVVERATKEQLATIEEIVNKHAGMQGSAIPILQDIQERLGYVSPAFLKHASDLTRIPASDLYSIVTFYAQFRTEPLGENHLQICHGTACHLAGAEKITDALEHETKTKCGCTSEDGKYTLEKVACIGCCSLAPVINLNGEIHGRLTPEQISKLMANVDKGVDGNGN